MDRSGLVFLLLMIIVVVFLFTTGRLQAAFDALSGKRELAANVE